MTLYIFTKNIFEKMIDIQECETEESKIELIKKYVEEDIDFKWLIKLIKSKPNFKIDYEKEIKNNSYESSVFSDGIFGGMNKFLMKSKGLQFFDVTSDDMTQTGNQLINHAGMKVLIPLVDNGNREKIVDFIREMAYFNEQLFLVDILNSESDWIAKETLDQIDV